MRDLHSLLPSDPLDLVQPSLLFLTLLHLRAALAAQRKHASNQCGLTCRAAEGALVYVTHITC
jgi:hypothetical protein